jgi:hypothetical protein
MTIRLTMKKKKILTNYHNEAICKTNFHVIYIMDDIFCNTKYLFYKFVLFKHCCYCFVRRTVYHLSVCMKVNRQYKHHLSCTLHYHRRIPVRRHFTVAILSPTTLRTDSSLSVFHSSDFITDDFADRFSPSVFHSSHFIIDDCAEGFQSIGIS